MNQEERALLEETLRLSQENNKMIRSVNRIMRISQVWGFIKILVIIVPLVIGYFYLEPYFGSINQSFQNAQDLLNVYR